MFFELFASEIEGGLSVAVFFWLGLFKASFSESQSVILFECNDEVLDLHVMLVIFKELVQSLNIVQVCVILHRNCDVAW